MFCGITPSSTPLPAKEFRKHYDQLLITGRLNPEILWYCDIYQQTSLNDLKKGLKRVSEKT